MGEDKYRLIAIDLDGTLLSPAGHVTPRVKRAVRKVLDAGLLVCFATGRNWTESRTVLEAIEHYDSAVFVGGAMVVDTKKQVVLHRTVMQPELARELCAHLEAEGHAVLAGQDPLAAGFDYVVTGDLPMTLELSITAAMSRKGMRAQRLARITSSASSSTTTPSSLKRQTRRRVSSWVKRS